MRCRVSLHQSDPLGFPKRCRHAHHQCARVAFQSRHRCGYPQLGLFCGQTHCNSAHPLHAPNDVLRHRTFAGHTYWQSKGTIKLWKLSICSFFKNKILVWIFCSKIDSKIIQPLLSPMKTIAFIDFKLMRLLRIRWLRSNGVDWIGAKFM